MSYQDKVREIDSLHARLSDSSLSTTEIKRGVSVFNEATQTNCQAHAEAMLYAVLPIVSMRPELEKELLYYPVSDLVAWGFNEPEDISAFFASYIGSKENYLPLKFDLRDWFSKSRSRLEKLIIEILDENWPR